MAWQPMQVFCLANSGDALAPAEKKTEAIRLMPGFESLPIVAMTANVMEGERAHCLAAGMNDHVGKPIEPQALCRALLQWIQPRAGLGHQGQPPTLQPAATAPTDSDLEGIEGLDVAPALRRMRGKEALYRSILAKFITGQRDFGARLQAALDAEDLAQAERHAHTLKGVSATIGAASLSEQAGELERMLRAKEPLSNLQGPLTKTCQTLHVLINALEPRLASIEMPSASTGLDTAALAGLCDELNRLLQDSDLQAFQVFEKNGALLQAAFPGHISAMRAAAAEYDADALLAALKTALQ